MMYSVVIERVESVGSISAGSGPWFKLSSGLWWQFSIR